MISTLRLVLFVSFSMLIMAACSGNGDDDDNITNGNGDSNSMIASVNGKAFSATTTVGAKTSQLTSLQVTGYGKAGSDSLTISITLASPSENSFPLGGENNQSAVATVTNLTSYHSFVTGSDVVTGSVEIESLSSDKAKGTFYFTAYGVADSLEVTDGNFNVDLVDLGDFSSHVD